MRVYCDHIKLSAVHVLLYHEVFSIVYCIIEYAEITESPGAGHYRRRDSEVGTGLKRSLSARHREGIHAGYPNSLIAPVDTLGQAKIKHTHTQCH